MGPGTCLQNTESVVGGSEGERERETKNKKTDKLGRSRLKSESDFLQD